MLRLICIIIISLSVVACSLTRVTPYLTSEPLVLPGKLSTYWVSQHDIQPLKYMNREQRTALSGSTVVIKAEYLIDSNGDVFEVKILESNVEASFSSLVARSLQNRAFKPSATNTNRQPVVVQSMLTFECN